MKTKLTLKIVDVAADLDAMHGEALEAGAAVRPLDDHWRDKAAKILRTAFPATWVHRGGHHIAFHAQGPMPFGCMESTPCLARMKIEAENNPAKLKYLVTNHFARPWREKAINLKAENVRAICAGARDPKTGKHWPDDLDGDGQLKVPAYQRGELPFLPAFISATCDVQGDKFKWTICGFKADGTCALIDYGACLSSAELYEMILDPRSSAGDPLALPAPAHHLEAYHPFNRELHKLTDAELEARLDEHGRFVDFLLKKTAPRNLWRDNYVAAQEVENAYNAQIASRWVVARAKKRTQANWARARKKVRAAA